MTDKLRFLLTNFIIILICENCDDIGTPLIDLKMRIFKN